MYDTMIAIQCKGFTLAVCHTSILTITNQASVDDTAKMSRKKPIKHGHPFRPGADKCTGPLTHTYVYTHTQAIPQHSAAAVSMETAWSPSPQPYEKRAPTSGDPSLPHAYTHKNTH